jgi:[ribosomal protein S5]-alanine N-acetyltransferase
MSSSARTPACCWRLHDPGSRRCPGRRWCRGNGGDQTQLTALENSLFSNGFTLPPPLTSGSYNLRAIRRSDARDWSNYLSDPEVTRNTSWGAVDVDAIDALVQRIISDYSTGSSCRWAIARSDDDVLIGTCGFSWWSSVHWNAELVYDLSRPYWRRGIMHRAVETILQWAFATARLNRVQAVVMTTNQPSIALLERCGFAREGLLRRYRMARGTPADFYMYSRLRAAER